MTIRFCDSFDSYTQTGNALNDVLTKWTSSASYTYWYIREGRSGTNGLRFAPGAAQQTYLYKSLDAQSTWYASAWVSMQTNNGTQEIFQFHQNNRPQVTVMVLNDGRFRAARGNSTDTGVVLGDSSAGLFSPGQAGNMECKVVIHGTTGSVEVKFQGVTVLNLTNVNTSVTGVANADAVVIGGYTTTSNVCVVDDVVFADGTSSQSWIGDVHIQALYPNGPGATTGLTLSTGAGFASYRAAVLADNPLHFWELDQTSGTVATDTGTGSALTNGTYVGGYTLNQPGPFGGAAVEFDGVDGSLTVALPSDLLLATTSDWTVSSWVYIKPLSQGWYPNVVVWSRGSVGNIGWEIYIGGDGKLRFRWAALNDNALSTSPAEVPLGRWFHIAQSYRTSTNQTITYVNGRLMYSWSIPIQFNGGSLRFGGSTYGAGNIPSFQGRMAFIAGWASVLSQTQIQKHVGWKNWAAVADPIQNGDTTYVSAGTTGLKDTYTFDDLSISPTIRAIQLCTVARKDDGGVASVVPVIRSGGTDYDQATFVLNDTYNQNTQIIVNDPATAVPWVASGINSAEFGVKRTV